MKILFTLILLVTLWQQNYAQLPAVPSSYSNIRYDEEGRLFFEKGDNRYYADTAAPQFTLPDLYGRPAGTEEGIDFDFGKFKGTITYGMIPYGKAPHPYPVFRLVKPLKDGKVSINIKTDFRSVYDFTGWAANKQFSLGYRLTDERGRVIYDGEVAATGTGPFVVAPALSEGPFVSNITDNSAVIWLETTEPCQVIVRVNNREWKPSASVRHHEFRITGLQPGRVYEYEVRTGSFLQQYKFQTAPAAGSRKPFVFGYASDSRNATGGGERNIYGANAYIMKKLAALAFQQKAAFVQFTGDMINGYLTHKEEIQVQYSNWKKAIEPFWHYMPFYAGQGNHEALGYIFRDTAGRQMAFVDKFPFDTHSAEAAFGEAFVNPENGPDSEDGSVYDPDPRQIDFPSYKENVYYYTYDNVAMIVLNSDYWFAPSISRDSSTGGGLHGYIMDKQLDWLRGVIQKLEKDPAIDHIFVTQHTPVLPNGGHIGDDMWYSGNNRKRAYVAGKPLEKGIIERRDEYLNILINQNRKVLAVLTGDEHNYNRLMLTKEVEIYPDNYPFPKLLVSRPLFLINNGAAGAPYYAQEQLPWSPHTKAFSVENALCLFFVNGKKVSMKVVNPDTLNPIDEIRLR